MELHAELENEPNVEVWLRRSHYEATLYIVVVYKCSSVYRQLLWLGHVKRPLYDKGSFWALSFVDVHKGGCQCCCVHALYGEHLFASCQWSTSDSRHCVCAFFYAMHWYQVFQFFSVHHELVKLPRFDCTHEMVFCCVHVVVLVSCLSEYINMVKKYSTFVVMYFITRQEVICLNAESTHRAMSVEVNTVE